MSISSSEGSPLPLDLPSKYQKLAAEYAKVRANVAVLKKAVLDEQTRSIELKEAVKSKDQTLRKYDQELDSLVFRNQQLTKRVTVLQEDLDRIQEHSKKGRSKQDSTSVSEEESKLFQEELQTRIIENAKLLSQLDERDQELERERRQWHEMKEKFESQLMEARNSQINNRHAGSSERRMDKPQGNVARENSTWLIVLQSLPFSNLYGPLETIIQFEIGLEIPNLENVFQEASPDVSYSALYEHLMQITLIGNNLGKSNAMVSDFVAGLIKLDSELLACCESAVPSYPLTAISNIVDQLNSNVLRYKGSNQNEKIKNAFIQLKSGCECFQRALKQISSNQLNRLKSGEKSLEKKIVESCVNGPTTETVASSVTTSSEPQSKTVLNEFGDGTIVEEPAWLDKSVREHIASVTNSLVNDRQLAESKFTSVLKECEALKTKLEHYSLESLKKDEQFNKMQEELSVTRRNYEEQLSSMSEHMANMNDKLAAQEAMIEELTFELTKRDNKSKVRTK